MISRSESASASSRGGGLLSRRRCSVEDRWHVLRGAIGSAIAVLLCLRAVDGVRTSSGCPAPVAGRFVARAVGVVQCGWGSLTLPPRRIPRRTGAERCSLGSAGRSRARGGLVPPRLRGAFGFRRSSSPGRPLAGRAASPLTGSRGVRRWALPLPGRPSLGSGSRGPLPMCVGRGCVGVGSQRCPFGASGLRRAVHCGGGRGGSPERDLALLRGASGVRRPPSSRRRPGPVARVPWALVVWVCGPCTGPRAPPGRPPGGYGALWRGALVLLWLRYPSPGRASVGVRGWSGDKQGAACRLGGGRPSPGGWLPAVVRGVWCRAPSLPWPRVPGSGLPGPIARVSRARAVWGMLARTKRPPGGCLAPLRGAPEVRRLSSPGCPPSGQAVTVRCPLAVGAGVQALSFWLSCTAGGCV